MNIVLITVDCLRADRVGFMGHDAGSTPFLDELSEEGTVFEDAFATGPTTTQSMPGLMTGTYPSWFGGYPPIPESQMTLAQVLRDAGYATVGIHSNPWLHPSHRFDAGFDTYIDITEGRRQESRPDSKTGETTSANSLDTAKRRLVEMLKSTYYEFPISLRRIVSQSYFMCHYLFDRAQDKAEIAVDQAINTIEQYETEDLFLWVHFMDVHRPYTLSSTDFDNSIRQTARITQPAYTSPTPEDQEYISKVYDQSVAYVDNQIKRLHQGLEQHAADEETLFVITSDHGEEFGEHGDWFHRNFKLYDELIHVPLLIAGQDVQPQRKSGLISLADVAPTVLNHVDLSVPKSMTGQGMDSILRGGRGKKRDAVISEIFDPDRDLATIRTKEWKLIRDRVAGVSELYNLEKYPGEQNNVIEATTVPEHLTNRYDSYLSNRQSSEEIDMDMQVQGRLKDLGYLE